MRLPPLTLVIGTAASGKTPFAEKLVRQSGLAKTYVATADSANRDLAEMILSHRQARAGQGWHTVEAPLRVAEALARLEADEVAVVDCLTMWLSNLLTAGPDWAAEIDVLCEGLVQLRAPVVLVSADVGAQSAPRSVAPWRFQQAQGRMNQRIARLSTLVVQMTAGLPRVLKGHDLAESDPSS